MKATETCNTVSIYDTLFDLFERAISAAYPDVPDPPVIITSSSNPKFGDYQCNSAMSLTKQLSSMGKKYIVINVKSIGPSVIRSKCFRMFTQALKHLREMLQTI